MRLLGIDFGRRRIGLALSDPTGTIASPLTTLERRGGAVPWAELERLVALHEVGALVVGLPLDLAGTETPWTAEVRAFGEELARRTGRPVHWIDERLSSVRAERAVRSLGLPKRERERKERIDAAAAALLLQNFLRRRELGGP